MLINLYKSEYDSIVCNKERTAENFVSYLLNRADYTDLGLLHFKEKIIFQIQEMIDILESYNYPWDFFISEDHLTYGLIYYFGDTTIISECGNCMPLFDCYIALPIKINDHRNVTIQTIYFSRTTFTKYEAIHNYIHSHISSQNFCIRKYNSEYGDTFLDIDDDDIYYKRPMFGPFCLGNTEIQTNVFNLAKRGYDKLNFELLINQIESFIKWESISGMPYICLTDVINSTLEDELSTNFVYQYLTTKQLVYNMFDVDSYRNIFHMNDFLVNKDYIQLKYSNVIYNKLNNFLKVNKFVLDGNIKYSVVTDGQPKKIVVNGYTNVIDIDRDDYNSDDEYEEALEEAHENMATEDVGLFFFRNEGIKLKVVHNIKIEENTDNFADLSKAKFQEFYQHYNRLLLEKYCNYVGKNAY